MGSVTWGLARGKRLHARYGKELQTACERNIGQGWHEAADAEINLPACARCEDVVRERAPDLLSMLPVDITGGVDPVEHVRRMRGGADETPPPPPAWLKVTRKSERLFDENFTSIHAYRVSEFDSLHAQPRATVNVLSGTATRGVQVAVSTSYLDLDAIPWLIGELRRVAREGVVQA